MASGWNPHGSLTLSGTTLYGMTLDGGTDRYGNIFSVGIDGSGFQNLYSFTGGADGGYPYGDLTFSGGTLFGMTSAGGNGVGTNGDGTVFALVLPTPEPGTLAARRRRSSCAGFVSPAADARTVRNVERRRPKDRLSIVKGITVEVRV